jgi:membrane protease YdiL (CAAX protease family)
MSTANPLWIVLYLTLFLLWRQFFPSTFSPSGGYLILPFSFLASFIFLGMARGRLPGAVEDLVGRWLPRRADRPIVVAFILAAFLLRVLLSYCFGITPQSKQFAMVADLAALAPLNEELIFRGFFLGILLARLPSKPSVAVIWSAAIFLGFHGYAGDDVPAVACVLSLGLLCASAYAITQCVPLCIACHALFNILGWWTDAPRPMDLSDILWGLALFIFGATVIGLVLRLFIQRKRCGGFANQITAANGQPG